MTAAMRLRLVLIQGTCNVAPTICDTIRSLGNCIYLIAPGSTSDSATHPTLSLGCRGNGENYAKMLWLSRRQRHLEQHIWPAKCWIATNGIHRARV